MEQKDWLLELQNKNPSDLISAIEFIKKEKDRYEDKISILDLKIQVLRLILENKKEIQKINKFNEQVSDVIENYKHKLQKIKEMFEDLKLKKISKDKFLEFLSYEFIKEEGEKNE